MSQKVEEILRRARKEYFFLFSRTLLITILSTFLVGGLGLMLELGQDAMMFLGFGNGIFLYMGYFLPRSRELGDKFGKELADQLLKERSKSDE